MPLSTRKAYLRVYSSYFVLQCICGFTIGFRTSCRFSGIAFRIPQQQTVQEQPKAIPSASASQHILKASQSPPILYGLSIKDILATSTSTVGNVLHRATGWVKTARKAAGGSLLFIELNDGSSRQNLQVVVHSNFRNFSALAKVTIGCAIDVWGDLCASEGRKQDRELVLTNHTEHLAVCYGIHKAEGRTGKNGKIVERSSPYPLRKQKYTNAYLRSILHLRSRTAFFAAVTRFRSKLTQAIHQFFDKHQFIQIHSPVITTCDCEGAGKRFEVHQEGERLLQKNHSRVYFNRPAYLTVSNQLSLESCCSALSKVYSIGPTFRAENSDTSRHLAEFWMIEAEVAFCDLKGIAKYAEDLLMHCVNWTLSTSNEDLEFFDALSNGELKRDLVAMARSQYFTTISHKEAAEVLHRHQVEGKVDFAEAPSLHKELKGEHELYLTEKVMHGGVILCNHPKASKAFYMRLNEDNSTVASMDILLPRIGEVCGGSQREERLEMLDSRMDEFRIPHENYDWYRDLRKYGSVPHSGFGVGFERLLMLLCGIRNIRDVIAFPRYPSHALP